MRCGDGLVDGHGAARGRKIYVLGRGNGAVNGHGSARRGGIHVVACRECARILHIALGVQRDVAVRCGDRLVDRHGAARGRKFYVLGCGNDAANGHGSARRCGIHVVPRRERARILHIALGVQRDVALRCGNVAFHGHGAVGGSELHVMGCRDLFVRRHAAVGFQRNIAFGMLSVAICPKRRADPDRALTLRVFCRDIAVDRGRNGKRQRGRAVLDRNAARDGGVGDGALHRKGAERVARARQRYISRADGGNLLCLDARRRVLGDARRRRGQRHIRTRHEGRARRLRQVALRRQGQFARGGEIPVVGQRAVRFEILDRDIPCRFLVDLDGQRVGVVHNAHVSGNGRRAAAVHGDTVELVPRVFQEQGFPVHGMDGVGGNRAFVRLGDAAVLRFQRQRLRVCRIAHRHRAVQCQIVRGGKRRVAADVDGAFHRRFHDISGPVLLLFPSHGKRAFALRNEFSPDTDVSEGQRSVPDIRVAHAFQIGHARCLDIHRGAVVQDADGVELLAHDAGRRIRLEGQRLAGVDIGGGNVRIGVAHLEALVALDGDGIARVHGAQAERIVILHVLDEHALVGPGLGEIPGQGNGQRLVRRADALFAAGEDQVVSRDIGLGCGLRVVDALVGIQAHVARRGGVDGAHVDRGVVPFRVGAARHGDIAARLHVQRAAGLDAQGHIALDHEFRQIAVFPHSRDIGSPHAHELLHLGNARILVCQRVHGNLGGLVGNGAYRLGGRQRDILAQDVGGASRLRAAAAGLVHQRVADGVEHHVLRPRIGGILRLVLHFLIFLVHSKISVRARIPLEFVCVDALQIFLRRFVILIREIILMTFGCELRRFLRVGQSRVVACAVYISLIVL